jgi:hypothetical protein
MAKSKEEFDIAVEELKSANTEEDITKQLTLIVKRFSVPMYKEMVLTNPYYKNLFVDIKEDVILDLENLKDAINEEMRSIEKELRKDLAPLKLKELKDDCISLLYEVERKISEIESI